VKRRLFNVAAAMSLVLWLGTVALWMRSYRFKDVLCYSCPPKTIGVGSIHGRVGFEWITLQGAPTGPASAGWYYTTYADADPPPMPSTGWLARLGFGYSANGASNPLFAITGGLLVIPHWAVATVLAVPSLRWFWKRHRRAGRSRAFCARCGYDLRATPDRCPECGAAPNR
jgi:hypothetical protein